MKRSSFLLTLVLALCCLAGCGAPANGGQSDPSPSQSAPTGESGERPQRVLVAYFSATGNTETLARYAAQALGADLYEIEPEIPYTADDLNYSDGGSRASVEMGDAAARPAIATRMEGMEGYDVVLLGYPIWWGQAPRIVSTFLESYDFGGKTVVPFCTSGSSDIGSSAEQLHPLCGEGVIWLTGRRFAGGTSYEEMAQWVGGLELPPRAEQ